jgi:Tfp pilus assembly protein PilV
MIPYADSSHPYAHARQAFSLMEATLATLLVGVSLVAALRVLGGSTAASLSNADRAAGLLLAQDLVSEILNARYVEPEEAPSFGPEPSENDATRSAFDDVDDYHNWDASPPQSKDGTAISDRTGWGRSVTVEYADPNDLTATVGSDQGVKRITVTVTRNDKVLARLVGARTSAE